MTYEYNTFYGAVTQHMPLQGRLDKKPLHMPEIWFLEIVSLESRLERIQGSSPKQVLDFHTFRSSLTSDHRRDPALNSDTKMQYDFR